MTDPIAGLDEWLRGDFVRINTELEEAYFADRVDVIVGRPVLDALKQALLRQGGERMARLAELPALPADPHAAYRLLGLVGHYLAACQRHDAGLSDELGGQAAAWSVSLRIGSALGVAPRFVFAHQSLYNEAVGGRCRTFTSLRDEAVFIRLNAEAVLAYRSAADALRDLAGLGVSNLLAAGLLDRARAALDDVLEANRQLSQELDVERFYFNIRPYFKSYRVGAAEHRGANAGDFSAINEIDVGLGLCSMRDPFYRSVVHEKAGHVPPGDQPALRSLDRAPSLLRAFCDELDAFGATPAWRANAARFLDVCKAHGAAYAFHHQRLVRPFLEAPARAAPTAHSAGVTSSGPPLDEVMALLQRLLLLRTARDRPGIGSAAAGIERIRAGLQLPAG
jgi:hypothetical protein